jgi:hypothetical protein
MKKSLLITLGLVIMVSLSLALTKNDPIFKNLQVLPKNITERQLDSLMDHYSVSLNVDCGFCHVKIDTAGNLDYAADGNKHKLVARDMIRMTEKINEKYFNVTGTSNWLEAEMMVTCYTCHQGQKEPRTKPKINTGQAIPDSTRK